MSDKEQILDQIEIQKEQIEIQEAKLELKETQDKWKNRRRITWMTAVGAMLYPLLVLVTESDVVSNVAVHYYLYATAVVSVYIGAATWAGNKRNEDDSNS